MPLESALRPEWLNRGVGNISKEVMMAGNQGSGRSAARAAAKCPKPWWDAALLTAVALFTAGILLRETPWLSAALDESPIAKPLAECSTEELKQVQRTEGVAVELLRRPDLDQPTALAAVRRLAAIREATPSELLMEWVSGLDDSSPIALRRNLVGVVSYLPTTTKQECCEAAKRLASTAVRDEVRQTALAVCIAAEGDSSVVLASVQANREQLVDFLKAVPLVSNHAIQRKAWSDIRPLLGSGTGGSGTGGSGTGGSGDGFAEPSVQALVLRVVVQWEGDESEKASEAMRLLCSGQCRVAAMEALVALPTSSWPEEHLGRTAAAVIAWLAETPADGANWADRATALKLCDQLGPLFSGTRRTRFENRLREIAQR